LVWPFCQKGQRVSHDAMVENRHAGLERDRHAGPIDLGEDVVRKVRARVCEHQALDRILPGCAPVAFAEELAGSEVCSGKSRAQELRLEVRGEVLGDLFRLVVAQMAQSAP
jgi:hypothetical protein